MRQKVERFIPLMYNGLMSSNKFTPLVIGVAGGSGSGKTTVANIVLDRVGRHRIAYLPHDAYYRDLTSLPLNQRIQINFDHPDSLESDLLVEHIQRLKAWETIQLPIYDFTHHRRTDKSILVKPQRVILVEGILIFAEKQLRELFDVKILLILMQIFVLFAACNAISQNAGVQLKM